MIRMLSGQARMRVRSMAVEQWLCSSGHRRRRSMVPQPDAFSQHWQWEVPVAQTIRTGVRMVAPLVVMLLGTATSASVIGGNVNGGPIQDVYDGYAVSTMSSLAASS